MEKFDLFRMKDDMMRIATKVGDMIRPHFFKKEKEVEEKTHHANLVTTIDSSSEDFILRELKKLYPKFSIISEEKNEENPLTDEPTWIIDPIDGTTFSFSIFFTKKQSRIPIIAVSIAFAFKKESLIGVAYNPVTDEKFYAIKNNGAFLNDKKIEVSGEKDLKKSIISSNFSYYDMELLEMCKFREMIKECTPHGIRVCGSAVMTQCYVAMGSYDIYFEKKQCKIWDLAAGTLIIREAGGVISQYDGSEYKLAKNELVACSSKEIHKEFIKLLKKLKM